MNSALRSKKIIGIVVVSVIACSLVALLVFVRNKTDSGDTNKVVSMDDKPMEVAPIDDEPVEDEIYCFDIGFPVIVDATTQETCVNSIQAGGTYTAGETIDFYFLIRAYSEIDRMEEVPVETELSDSYLQLNIEGARADFIDVLEIGAHEAGGCPDVLGSDCINSCSCPPSSGSISAMSSRRGMRQNP